MISDSLFARFYPDKRWDGIIAFYGWLRKKMTPQSRVLNPGADPTTCSSVQALKGEVAKVAGVDIDPVMFESPELNRAVLNVFGRLNKGRHE